MENINRVPYFIIILLAIFIFITIDHSVLVARYPYMPFIAGDPAAAYLTSAIYILEGHAPFYYQHPGSAYYVLLALGLVPFKLYSAINHSDFVEFVYLHKEIILIYLQFFTLFFSLAGLFLLNRATVNITKKEWTGFFVVLLFLSFKGEYQQKLWIVSAEGYLIFISGVTLFFFSRYIMNTQKERYLYLCFLSLGLGFAGKLTILPLGIFLFLFLIYGISKTGYPPLLKLKRFIKFSAMAVLGFILGTAILGDRMGKCFTFIFRTLTHTGQYGKGEIGFDATAYMQNILEVFKRHGFFIIIFIVSQILLFNYARLKNKNEGAKQAVAIGLFSLAAFVIHIVLQCVEPYGGRYLIVTLILAAFSLSISLQVLLRDKRIFIVLGIFIVIVGSCLQWRFAWHNSLRDIKGARDMDRLIERHKIDLHTDTVIFNKGIVKNKNIYFNYADLYSFGMYNKVLYKYQPTILLYDIDTNKVTRYDRKTYAGKWDYAIIDKEIVKQFNALQTPEAEIIDAQGAYYLLVPAHGN